MPGWLIDLFGSSKLNETFWMLTLVPLPIWLTLVFFPDRRWTRMVASPWLAPFLLSLIYVLLMWELWQIGPPDLPASASSRRARVFLFHPVVFLVLWAHIQIANLFVGLVILEDARRRRHRVPVELALCWLFTPVAVLLYVVRRVLWLRRASHD